MQAVTHARRREMQLCVLHSRLLTFTVATVFFSCSFLCAAMSSSTTAIKQHRATLFTSQECYKKCCVTKQAKRQYPYDISPGGTHAKIDFKRILQMTESEKSFGELTSFTPVLEEYMRRARKEDGIHTRWHPTHVEMGIKLQKGTNARAALQFFRAMGLEADLHVCTGID